MSERVSERERESAKVLAMQLGERTRRSALRAAPSRAMPCGM